MLWIFNFIQQNDALMGHNPKYIYITVLDWNDCEYRYWNVGNCIENAITSIKRGGGSGGKFKPGLTKGKKIPPLGVVLNLWAWHRICCGISSENTNATTNKQTNNHASYIFCMYTQAQLGKADQRSPVKPKPSWWITAVSQSVISLWHLIQKRNFSRSHLLSSKNFP